MALQDILAPPVINDINTASNLTSAGLGIALLNIAKETLKISKQTLETIQHNYERTSDFETMQLRLLKEIAEELQKLNSNR